MTRLSDFNTDLKFEAEVLSTERLTPANTEEIRELVLELKDSEFECRLNQSFGVLVETNGEFGHSSHHRLYSVADVPERVDDKTRLKLLVKRCNYIDEFSGEEYKGVASNYLCDRRNGDSIFITGPYEVPFKVPENNEANMLLIGMGTGIAPFRAFIKHIYENEKEWKGKIRLFYGAKSGLELLYLNEEDGDLTNYYDKDTFKAFHALSPRPHWADPIALGQALIAQGQEIRSLLSKSNTYIYVAGYEKIRIQLEKAFSTIMGSEESWQIRKAQLVEGKHWAEIIY